MRWLDLTPLLALVFVACGGDPGADGGPDAGAGHDAAPSDAVEATCIAAATYEFSLAAGAFPPSPDHPNVIVRVPDRFDSAGPIDLVVYIHGFNNCITNILGDTNTACTPGGPARIATHLAAQLDASDRNALLVLPEVAYDMASSDPGTLGSDGGFRALLEETLATLPPPLGPRSLADVGRVMVASHSGGYSAVSSMITVGGVDVDELWLFDSLYGFASRFDAWIEGDLPSFVAGTRRFAAVYTGSGGTLDNTQAMADRAAEWVAANPEALVDDRTTATWPDDTYHHGLLFKASALSHNGVPEYYFERMLATSQLAPRACP
jgi:hypothetical protein